MGNFKRIPVQDIRAMQKILDDLPDKNLGKTREEAVDLLSANIQKALEKGYTVQELEKIMAEGNVAIPARVIRAKVFPTKVAPRKKPAPQSETVNAGGNVSIPKSVIRAEVLPTKATPQKREPAPRPETVKPAVAQPQEQMPAYYTPDKPDTEL